MDILALRSYVRAKELVDNTKRKTDLPKSHMVDMVFEVAAELMREARERSG